MEEWFLRTTRKQRITGTRLHRQLVEEDLEVGVTTVRSWLREWCRQRSEVYIPLVHRPGEEAQVDFFKVTVDEAGFRRTAWKFLLRLPFSAVTSSGSTIVAISWRFSTATCGRSPTSAVWRREVSTTISQRP